jgi:hypothetical protein
MTSFNFKDYDIKVWLKNNKKDIKLLIVSLVAVATYFSTNSSKPIAVSIAAIVGVLGKFGLDALDYYISE